MIKNTCVFKRSHVMDDVIDGIKGSQEEMKKNGGFNDDTTHKDISTYASQHIVITESKIEKAKNELD
jgi:hypothetical protein